MGVLSLVKRSPRFGILLTAIFLAIIFTILDIVASIDTGMIGTTDGINPWWKLSLIFKCLTDAILLDDFKTELKRLGVKRIKRDEKRRQSVALVLDENNDDLIDDTDEEPDSGTHLTMANTLSNTPNGNLQTHSSGQSSQSPGPKNEREELEFSDMLKMEPSDVSSTDNGRRPNKGRAQVGQGGTKATRLPGLLNSFKPGKKKKVKSSMDEDREKGPDPDLIAPANEGLEQARQAQMETLRDLRRENGQTSTNQRLSAAKRSLGYDPNLMD